VYIVCSIFLKYGMKNKLGHETVWGFKSPPLGCTDDFPSSNQHRECKNCRLGKQSFVCQPFRSNARSQLCIAFSNFKNAL